MTHLSRYFVIYAHPLLDIVGQRNRLEYTGAAAYMPAIPKATAPDACSPDVLQPDARSPDARSPDARSPDARSPDACSSELHDIY